MEEFDLAAARRAAELGRLDEWLIALLHREPGANRSLAAMIKGQRPLLEGPVLVALASLETMAGPGENFRYPKDSAVWESEIEPMLLLGLHELPPLIVRETAGVRHLSDGNHRVDAWRRRGEAQGWAIVWRDRDPRFSGWWSPFPPERTPRIEVIPHAGDFLPPVDEEGLVLAALVGDQVVGAVRLVPEFGALTLRTMSIDPTYRGLRLGVRLLHHLRPQMDGQTVHCLAYPWLERFYGEFGFRPVEPTELSEGLRLRYESFQDEKGCVALRREG